MLYEKYIYKDYGTVLQNHEEGICIFHLKYCPSDDLEFWEGLWFLWLFKLDTQRVPIKMEYLYTALWNLQLVTTFFCLKPIPSSLSVVVPRIPLTCFIYSLRITTPLWPLTFKASFWLRGASCYCYAAYIYSRWWIWLSESTDFLFFFICPLSLQKKNIIKKCLYSGAFSPISSKQQPPTERISAHTRTASGNIFVVSYGSEKMM